MSVMDPDLHMSRDSLMPGFLTKYTAIHENFKGVYKVLLPYLSSDFKLLYSFRCIICVYLIV